MAAEYPGTIKNWTDLQDHVDEIVAAHLNTAYAEITAIQTELGLLPKGGYASVAARLAGLSNAATIFVAASNASVASKAWAAATGGFVCDGTADEYEINLAIAALPAGGGKVLLSEGTFTLAARINNTTQDNIVLEGVGRGATIITAVNASTIDSVMVRISGRSDCSVRRLSIDGNKANQTILLCGLYLENCNNCDVEDVAILDTTHAGLYFSSGGSTSPNHVRRVLITGAGDLAVVAGGSAGLLLEDDIGSVIEDVTVFGSSGHGMVLGDCDYTKLIRPYSTNNRFRGIAATSARLEIMNLYTAYNGQVGTQILGHAGGGHRIIGGVTERNGYRKDSGSANAAVTITGGGGGTATLTDTREAFAPDVWIGAVVTCNTKTFTVTGNDDETLTGTGGWDADPGADGQAWTMAATFSEGSGLIITTSPHSVVMGLTSRYNAIDNGPDENGGIGIENCDFVELLGCIAEYNGGPGFFPHRASDCKIIGGSAMNNGQYAGAGHPYGITLGTDGVTPSSRNLIAHVRSGDTQETKTQTYGMNIRPGAASSDNKVVDCDFLGNDTLGYLDSSGGTNNTVRNTVGVTGTAGDVVAISLVIDHASITDGGGATGYMDFAETIPAGSIIKAVKLDFTEAFSATGTSTLTMQIGPQADLDAYNKTVAPGENAYNHTTDVFWGESDCQVHIQTAAAAPRVTFTEDDDITTIISGGDAQGAVTVTITYMKA